MLRRKKCFNKIPVDSNYHWKNWVVLINRPTKQEKKLQLQKTYILRIRAQKFKSIYTYISWLPSIKRLHTMTTILLLKRNLLIYGLISTNVYLGISPPQKHYPIFLPSPPLNLLAVQALFFWKMSPNYRFFCEPTLKIRFFCEPP